MRKGRTPVIAGNWKMNTTPATAVELARAVAEKTAGVKGVIRVLCPPFVSLYAVRQAVAGSGILIGAQNVHAKESGAFTGEVSAQMLDGLADCVIVGHSERRKLSGESDADVAAKAMAAAARRIRPILCVGEPLEVRQSGRAEQHVRAQLRASLEGFDAWSYLIVAYEPVWAIGAGQAATPEQAQEMAGAVRQELKSLAGREPVDGFPVLYGGSVTGENVGPFVDRPDVDGALVGGASLRADEFARIVQVTAGIAASAK
jgi:triosephosphate isomerase